MCCQHALDGLQATLLSVEPGRQSQHTRWVLEFHRDAVPSEAAAERAEQRRLLFRELYTQSHACERFADEVLDVSLETWFGTHQDGGRVLEDVQEGLEDVVKVRYETLRMMWEVAVPDL